MSLSIKQAIIKTLCYADIFDYPLTLGEIHQYLIHSKPTSLGTIKNSTQVLLKASQIESSGGRVGDSSFFYSLKGRVKIFKLRKTREIEAEKKAKLGRGVGKWLVRLPWILAVYLTGATAVGNSTKNDDVDLMIITKVGKLWASRLIVTMGLDSAGLRRKPESRGVANKICTNLYLDAASLAVPTAKRDLYTAHEVVQAKPIATKKDIHTYFLGSNQWVKEFLPNTKIPKLNPGINSKIPGLISRQTFKFSSLPDSLAYRFQLRYMKSKITREKISPGAAYFHPRNTSKIILNHYSKRLKKYL